MSFNMDFFLFQIFPYIALAVFFLGSIVRFDRDPYGWRSKSSQFLRRRQLMWGSNLFHVGVLVVLTGHVGGLLTPIWIFEAMGITPAAKQAMAMTVGGIAGIFCLIGLLMLIHRRLSDPRIRATSSFADIAVLFLLLAQLCLGLSTIPASMQHMDGTEVLKFMNWAQSIVSFRVNAVDFIRDVAPVFKIHLALGMFILLVFPFTRLVHIWSAPVFYVFRRQYQIVRRREV